MRPRVATNSTQPARGGFPRRSRETVLQREFALFGGEFLLTLGAKDLRAWFAAFFAGDEDVWGGFLGGWPGRPGGNAGARTSSRADG